MISNSITFEPFPKIGRLSRDMIVTEKLDGTNAQIIVTEDGRIGAASRSRLLVTQGADGSWTWACEDNHGFGTWVMSNAPALRLLGPGRHFGEWWGGGIQRGYGLGHEKRFSLFNVRRWSDSEKRPACCHAVPTLYTGEFDTGTVALVMDDLKRNGSAAAPGFMSPEGVVIFHTQSGALFKKTFERDDAGKGREPMSEMSS